MMISRNKKINLLLNLKNPITAILSLMVLLNKLGNIKKIKAINITGYNRLYKIDML